MKIKNTNTFAVELSKSAESSIYVASWNGRADLEFTDRDEHGTVHKIEVCMPLEVARNLIDQLEVVASKMASAGLPTVVIAPSDHRRPLYDFATRFLSDFSVITARELTPGTHLEPTAMIQLVPTTSQ